MYRKGIILLGTTILTVALQAQTNLVPNPGFDEVDKKIKDPGQIELAPGWSSPTEHPADLYNKEAKNEAYMAPDNGYGREEPKSGAGYAGILVFSDREAEPRTYLQTELTQELDAEKLYCVKFHTTLGELAKHAVNNLGIYVSKEAPNQKEILDYSIEPQIIHSKNKLIIEQDYWRPICRVYKAEGGEKFLTIGNFAPQDDTKDEKMRRPRGFTGMQQRTGYYYIEDVSVIAVEELFDEKDCICEEQTNEMSVVVRQNVSTEHEMEDKQIISMKKAYFASGNADIQDDSYRQLEELAELLRNNPEIKVELVGNTDEVEQARAQEDISLQRAENVKEFLVASGIEESRVSVKGAKTDNPLSEEGTVEARTKNRRVDVNIVE